jgi:hypothetical protein
VNYNLLCLFRSPSPTPGLLHLLCMPQVFRSFPTPGLLRLFRLPCSSRLSCLSNQKRNTAAGSLSSRRGDHKAAFIRMSSEINVRRRFSDNSSSTAVSSCLRDSDLTQRRAGRCDFTFAAAFVTYGLSMGQSSRMPHSCSIN